MEYWKMEYWGRPLHASFKHSSTPCISNLFIGRLSWQLRILFFPQILILKFHPNGGRVVCRKNFAIARRG